MNSFKCIDFENNFLINFSFSMKITSFFSFLFCVCSVNTLFKLWILKTFVGNSFIDFITVNVGIDEFFSAIKKKIAKVILVKYNRPRFSKCIFFLAVVGCVIKANSLCEEPKSMEVVLSVEDFPKRS